jgi:hypothetical protein
MLRILLCQLACGIRPPARWAHNCRFHDELKWLGFGICPSRSRLYHFQQRLGNQLDVWLQEILGVAVARGITPATRAAFDGSTIAANASRHRMLNRKTLNQRLDLLAQAVAADDPAADAAAPTPAVPAPTPSNMQNCYNQTLDAMWFASHFAFGGRTPFAWSSNFLVAR